MDIEELADKIFALLKGNGLKLKIYDINGAETSDPRAGRRFFALDPNVMVSILEDENLVQFSKGGGFDPRVQHLAKAVKQLADKFLINSRVKVFGKAIRPKDYSYQAKAQRDNVMENTAVNHLVLSQVFKNLDYKDAISASDLVKRIPGSDLNEVQKALNRLVQDNKVAVTKDMAQAEVYTKRMEEAVAGLYESFSRLHGGKKTSRQVVENVSIIIRHRKAVDESVRGARSRSISSIFLEANGERFRFAHPNLQGARAMAQHLAHGGSMTDAVGSYITEATGQLMELRAFTQYAARNQLINESNQPVLITVRGAIQTLKETLHRLSGKRSYNTACARIETATPSDSQADVEKLRELFTVKRFDERFNDILPIVQQLLEQRDQQRRRIEEAANQIVSVRNMALSTAPMLEFANEHAGIGYKLSELASRIVNNEELSEFVAGVADKLRSGSKPDVFESTVIARVLENAVIAEEDDTEDHDDDTESLTECREFIGQLDKYIPKFL